MIKILRENNNELKQIPLDCIKGATLLSIREAERLLTKEERKCKGTSEAIKNGLYVDEGGNSSYWLRPEGYNKTYVCHVYSNGEVDDNYYVNYTFVGVRPALILNLKFSNLKVGDVFEFGNYTFKIISNNLALCDVIIDACPFNLHYGDGNIYEDSYIKTKVDGWFNRVCKDLERKEYGIETDDEIFDVKGMTGW